MLKFSLIIPVYNEECHITGCLEAVARQSEAADEVIVVDNNSTDNTVKLAKKYKFVKVVTEHSQGRGYARSAGFNAANGDILGRIDADSRVHKNWVKEVKSRFTVDPELYGLTGLGKTSLIPGNTRIKGTLFSKAYYWFVHAGFRTITMWGANMAIKKSAWEEVKNDVCLDDSEVHEDQDLSLWMAAKGLKIEEDNKMLITTNGQTYRYLPKSLHYISLFKKTQKKHQQNCNLSSPKLIKLGFFSVLPGRFYGLLALMYILLTAIIYYPIDRYILRNNLSKSYLK